MVVDVNDMGYTKDEHNCQKKEYNRIDTAKGSCNEKVEQLIDNLTLFDDTLMSRVFDNNISATELLLKIILQREDIEIIHVIGQKELRGSIVGSHAVRLDILAKEQSGREFNVEVQRDDAGAAEQRSRYHSSMLDCRMLKEGQDYKELADSYVIFITENDYFKAGLPVYTVDRQVTEINCTFKDGSHIIYVNGNYTADDMYGRLMKDFRCKQAKDIFYPELAKGMRYFKEEGGRTDMCKAVEEYAKEYAQEYARDHVREYAQEYAQEYARDHVREYAQEYAQEYARDHVREYAQEYAKEKEIRSAIQISIDFSIPKEAILQKVRAKFNLAEEEADRYYAECLNEAV